MSSRVLLGDVIDIIHGKNQRDVEAEHGTYPIYGSGGVMGRATQYLCPCNTVIIGRKGTINRPIFVDEPLWNVDTAFGLVADEKRLLPRYLFHFCCCYDFMELNTAATIPSLTKKSIQGIFIPLPSIDEQASICATLDSILNRREDEQSCTRAFNDLVKSRFVEMFGDQKTNSLGLPTSKLGDVAFVGSSKRVFKDELVESGVPFYRGTEVGALAFGESVTPEFFITRPHYQELVDHTGKPEIGDLLMPSICPDGQIWLVDTEDPFYFKDGRVLWVKPDRSIFNSTFLQYAMRDRFISDFESFASGTTFAELKIFVLKNLVVTVPRMEMQNEFAAFVQQVDKLKFMLLGIP